MAVRVLCANAQGEQPVPVKRTCTFAVSKLLPLMVSVNCCPATAGFGLVVSELMEGVGEVTESDRLPDCGPLTPFCTATVYAPLALSVTGPVTEVALLPVSRPFGVVQGEQLVPVIAICAFVVSKLEPFTVRLNCCRATAGLGTVLKSETDGVPELTVNGSVPNGAPDGPFCTETL